jgi:hypothetical protein
VCVCVCVFSWFDGCINNKSICSWSEWVWEIEFLSCDSVRVKCAERFSWVVVEAGRTTEIVA